VITIALTATLAAFSFTLTSESDDMTMLNVDVEVDGETVTVLHTEVDSVDAEDIRLDINNGKHSVQFDTFTAAVESAERFTAGDRWRHSVALEKNEVFVSVVHEPTRMVLARGWHTL
jgi:hypothetical protein